MPNEFDEGEIRFVPVKRKAGFLPILALLGIITVPIVMTWIFVFGVKLLGGEYWLASLGLLLLTWIFFIILRIYFLEKNSSRKKLYLVTAISIGLFVIFGFMCVLWLH